MPLPGSVTTVSVHGDIRGADGDPAVGRVRFLIPQALRDITGNVIVGPGVFTATLVNGEFVVPLIATNDPDLTPSGWTYQVSVETDVWREQFQIEVPAGGALEFADIAPAVAAPAVVTYALASQLGNYLPLTGGTLTGNLVVSTGGTAINAVNRGATNNFAAYTLRTAAVDRWALQMSNNGTNDVTLTDSANGNTALLAEARATAPNLSLLSSTKSYGSGVGVIYVANASTVPSTNPTGGGILYAENGALKWRGPSGTVTTIANA